MEPFKPIQGLNQQLSPIQSLSKIGDSQSIFEDDKEKKVSFGSIMGNQLNAVNQTLHESTQLKDKLIRGELENTHEMAVAGMKAGLMLRMTTAICSKVSSACTTLFQMQI
jgi:flagellar hook-basal body complex protein FliE